MNPAYEIDSTDSPPLRVYCPGVMDYERALRVQEELVERKVGGDPSDHLLVLEHPPVYTLGRGADLADLQGAPERLGVPVFRVSRGGGVTFHGPGQVVAYPIVALRHRGRDVHRYIRDLERVVVAVCERFGVAAWPGGKETGIWAGGGKIASIGIGVRRGVAFHGLALNVATDLGYFEAVVPCRMPGLRMTTLCRETGRADLPVGEVAAVLIRCFAELMGYREVAEEVLPWTR